MTHIHTEDCIKQDVIDLGDDDDELGYKAEDFYVCEVTSEEHVNLEDFKLQES